MGQRIDTELPHSGEKGKTEDAIDYERLEMGCVMLASMLGGRGDLADHERDCWRAIHTLLSRAEDAEKRASTAEYKYGEEVGRRKAMEIRAEKAEAEANELKRIHVYYLGGGLELTAKQLYDMLIQAGEEIKRLEGSREMGVTEFFEEKSRMCKFYREKNRILRYHCVGCGLFEAMAAKSIAVNSFNQGRDIEEVLNEWAKSSFMDPYCDGFVKDFYRKAAEVVTRWADAHPANPEDEAGESIIDLEKHALEGDQEAQEKLTSKGIALPCPRCKRRTYVFMTNDGYSFEVQCQKCEVTLGASRNAKDALMKWNRRPAKPKGHCKDCYYKDKSPCPGNRASDDGYCRYFL